MVVWVLIVYFEFYANTAPVVISSNIISEKSCNISGNMIVNQTPGNANYKCYPIRAAVGGG